MRMSQDFTPKLRHWVREFLSRPDYKPLRQHELARALKLSPTARRDFRHLLHDMEEAGELVCLRKSRWALPGNSGSKEFAGTLQVHARGFGFFIPDEPGLEDVFIPEDRLGTALHGDRVLVSVQKALPQKRQRSRFVSTPAERNLEGRVVRVLERAHATLAGQLLQGPAYFYVVPDNKRILHDVQITQVELPEGRKPEAYHQVVVRLHDWNDPRKPLTGTLIEDLGASDAPGVDMLSLMRSHQLDDQFPDSVLREAQSKRPGPLPRDFEGRRDLRDELIFTIDPEDAKDFDDAISLHRLPGGGWQLGVHIADVAHYVAKESEIDREARQRATSVYLVDRVITMLPGDLTTDTCSLRPEEERMAHTVEIHYSEQGHVLHAETYPSVIRSAARLYYDQVQAFFNDSADHGIPAPVRAKLTEMRELARLLRRLRIAAGSIDFNLPEIRCRLDAEGKPVEIVRRSAMESYQLIEDFMLAANQAVALRLDRANVPSMYRIHSEPSPENWAQMSQDLATMGIYAAPADRDDINQIARKAAGTPAKYAVNLAILRNLRRAAYSADRAEHFGLAFAHYTHFTSPIRRYPDLIVHRILNALEQGAPPPYGKADLAALAEHCSLQEQSAEEAERESVDIKRIEFYQDRLWKGETGPYPAVVAGLTPKGLIVELTASMQKGMVAFSSMGDDYYQIEQERGRAIGKRTGVSYRIGDRVSVELLRVDSARRRVDFRLEPGQSVRSPGKKSRRKTGATLAGRTFSKKKRKTSR